MAVDAASSFSFCRPAVEYRDLPDDIKEQLSARTGGNLTWHDGRGHKSAGGRAVKLLQRPGADARQNGGRYVPCGLVGCVSKVARAVPLALHSSTVSFQRQLQHLQHQPGAAQLGPPRGAVDAARRLQMAEEALPSQLPGLRGGLLASRHHRPGAAASQRRQAEEDGTGAGDAEAGAAPASSSAAGSGGRTQPAAAQQG
ncbi:sterile alpha motif domain-containing protein 10a isoform X2 [Festucalex cinctus]